MPLTTAELLAALPNDEREPSDAVHQNLEHILAALAGRQVPTGTWRRFLTLGGLSANITFSYFAYWMRSWFQAADAQQQKLVETHLRNALKTFATMVYLRGAVAKVGQFLASFPASMPDEFVELLGRLHFQTPPMHYSLIREQLMDELGDLEDTFAEFDEEAVAAASLGQVHRAKLHNGKTVAVKIQYPGVAGAVRSDLRNLTTFMSPFRITSDWASLQRQLAEIRTMLEEETDYVREVENLQEVGRLFHEEDSIVVPRVYTDLSSKRVLVMEFLEGTTFDEFLAAHPTKSERNAYGEKIFRAWCRLWVRGILYSDMHPGNFLFMDNGRLGFIDFGNLRRFNDEEFAFMRRLGDARLGSKKEVLAVCQESLEFTDEDMRDREDVVRLVVEGFHYYNEPITCAGEFDFGNEDYLRRGADWLARVSRSRCIRQKSANVFTHRANFQSMALLYRLGCRFDVHRIAEEEDLSSGQFRR